MQVRRCARRVGLAASVNLAVQERARRDDYRLRPQSSRVLQFNSADSICNHEQIGYQTLSETKVGCRLERAPHLDSIQSSISLRTRRLDRGPTRTIQQTELNAGAIDDARHDSAERIDFSNEMSFADSADRGIAGHLSDQIQVERQERSVRAQTRSGGRSFTAGMSGANHDHIKNFVEDHFRKPLTTRPVLTCRYKTSRRSVQAYLQSSSLRLSHR